MSKKTPLTTTREIIQYFSVTGYRFVSHFDGRI